jgi:hypothetical protein
VRVHLGTTINVDFEAVTNRHDGGVDSRAADVTPI